MTQRAVLVTGTSRGIGKATALRLASSGMTVIAGVRNTEDGARLEREAGGRLTSIVLDIGQDRSIAVAADVVRELVGENGLAGLVNNAAHPGVAGPMESVTRRDLEASFQVTTIGTLLTTRALLPLLKRARGRIVNVGAGRLPMPLLGTTFATKIALEALSDVLRVEVRKTGVRVSIVEPRMTRWDDAEQQLDGYSKALDDGLLSLPSADRERYETAVARLKALNRRMMRRAASTDDVAATIQEALTASRPRTRYYCGYEQRLAMILERFASTRMRDAIVGSITAL